MARRYSSFLVRHWHMDGGKERIRIEHIQSGDKTVVTSLTAALAWIDACCRPVGPEQPPPSRRAVTAVGDESE